MADINKAHLREAMIISGESLVKELERITHCAMIANKTEL